MKYRSILRFMFVLLIGLGVGSLVSWIIGIIAIGLAVVVGIIWLLFPRIASPILEGIRGQLEAQILEVTTDAKYNQTKLNLKITNAQSKRVSIKSFSNTLVKLDAEKISETLKVDLPIKLERPSITIVAYIDILPRYVMKLRNKKGNDKEHWRGLKTNFLLDTQWGEITWPITACFEQTPRIGNIN